jgi:hypothetical protein
VQQSAAGPEIYLGNPVYGGEELRGLIVVYFSPQSLVTTSPDPGSFALASPAGIIWPGAFGENAVLAGENWERVLRKKSCGLIGPKGSDFFWTTRYVRNLPLVYALPTSAGAMRLLAPAPKGKADPEAEREGPAKSSGNGTLAQQKKENV